MEAEQYTSEPTGELSRDDAVENSPNQPGTPADAIIGLHKAAPFQANAQFIRPFDLGVHTIGEKPALVNWPSRSAALATSAIRARRGVAGGRINVVDVAPFRALRGR